MNNQSIIHPWRRRAIFALLLTLHAEKSNSLPVTCLYTSMMSSQVVSKCVVASYDLVTKIYERKVRLDKWTSGSGYSLHCLRGDPLWV